MVNYHKQNIVKLAFNSVETHESRNICIPGSIMVLDGPASKTVLVAFVLAIQNTWDLNAQTRKAELRIKALYWCKCNKNISLMNGRAGSRYLRLQHYTFFYNNIELR